MTSLLTLFYLGGIPPCVHYTFSNLAIMSDNEGEGPSSVQFRGLSTHYVATDNMLASFRYPAGSYSARTEDWVGLFEEGATAIEQFLARADVKNTATHRPCDGGLWKSGKVNYGF